MRNVPPPNRNDHQTEVRLKVENRVLIGGSTRGAQGNARAHRAPHRAPLGTYPTGYLALGAYLRHSERRYLGG